MSGARRVGLAPGFSAAAPIYVNGRFATQKLNGVQRFAMEMATVLQRRLGAQVLLPPDASIDIAGARQVGRRSGQAWEQLELPRAARDGFLINLGNTAPVTARRQAVVIHDAGVFSTPAAYSWKFRLWYKALQFALVKTGAKIITVSEFSRGELVRHLPCRADDVGVIPEGADHMDRVVADPAILTAQGLEPGRFVFAVGTLAVHKNLTALGPLADALAARGMVLAISGSVGNSAFSGGEKMPSAARYVGRASDAGLKALYQSAACYIVPSLYEGFGLPAVEAMACGCPVVAADIPALRETCGDAALYVNPADPAIIAQTVTELLAAPERLQDLRTAAYARVQNLSWDNAANQLLQILDVSRVPETQTGMFSQAQVGPIAEQTMQ
jgi:glycosyltransferase involved in cell wall biosynthesis